MVPLARFAALGTTPAEMNRPPIRREFAERFAEEWIAAWNAHDLARILSHYEDDFEMASPLIVEIVAVLGHLKLTLCGHQELTHPPRGAAFVATRN